jgi:predicted secreted hydrolase
LALVLAVAGALYWALPPSEVERTSSSNADEANLLSALMEVSSDGFQGPSPSWKLDLPKDHGHHTNSRTESWHVATHLRNEDGKELGFQFSFLRLGIISGDAPPPTSIWDVREINRGHVAIFNTFVEHAFGEERFGRGTRGLAGYDPSAQELRLDNWFLRFDSDESGSYMTLYATVLDKAVVDLVMRPGKPTLALTPDDAGAPFVGYSMTRLAVEGTIDQGLGEETVTGSAWFDHVWGELPLPGMRPVASDRLQLQLGDGTDLSVIRTRRIDGAGAPVVSGFVVSPDGTASLLDGESLQMTSSRTWRDPVTGAEYPVEWRLLGPNLDITIAPLADAQAFDTAVPVWSGLVQSSGRRANTVVSGVGTLQLTGYSAP